MERLGNYELVERIGQGGMAEVFLARRRVEGVERRVVIKRILPQFSEMDDFVQMFVNEAKIAGRLEHPNITQLIDFGQVDGSHFLALEYIQGTDFKALVYAAAERKQFIPIEIALKVCSYACEALEYAHNLTDDDGEPLGFVHRDISPDNILLGYSGAVKVSDFGIARVRSLPKVTQTGMLKGKPHYAAPEYLRGKGIDHRADLFGLGVVLYEALTAERPFEAANLVDVIRTVVSLPTPDARTIHPEVPDAVQAILNRALQKDPAKRYAHAREFHADLEEALRGMGQPVSGRTIAELAAVYFPPKRPNTSSVTALPPAPLEATHPSYGQGPGPSGALTTPNLDRTHVRGRANPPQPGDVSAAATAVRRTPAMQRPAARGQDATLPSQDAATVPVAELNPLARAHREAYEAAEHKLTPEEEAARSPTRGDRRIPSWAVAALLGMVCLTAWWIEFGRPRVPMQSVSVHEVAGHALVVTSNVHPADVFVNEQLIGQTPLTLDNTYPFGQRTGIAVRAIGYTEIQAQFVGGRGQAVQATFGQVPEEE
jgi:serine/threonine protein kinase